MDLHQEALVLDGIPTRLWEEPAERPLVPTILTVHVALALSGAGLAGFLLGRKRYGWAVLVLLLLTPAALFSWYKATGLDAVAAWIYPSDTVYAARFDPDRFRKVSEGMSRQELIERLGDPLEKRTINSRQEYWYYSRAGGKFQKYWNFIVILNPATAKVTGQVKEFYSD